MPERLERARAKRVTRYCVVACLTVLILLGSWAIVRGTFTLRSRTPAWEMEARAETALRDWESLPKADRASLAAELIERIRDEKSRGAWNEAIERAWGDGLLSQPELEMYCGAAPEILAVFDDDEITVALAVPFRNSQDRERYSRLRIEVSALSLQADGVDIPMREPPSVDTGQKGADWPFFVGPSQGGPELKSIRLRWSGVVVDRATGARLVEVRDAQCSMQLRKGKTTSLPGIARNEPGGK